MPTKRTPISRFSTALNPGQTAYLRGEALGINDLPLTDWVEYVQLCERGHPARVGHPAAAELWAAAGAEFIAEWARERPGTRPWTWWRDASPERPRRGEPEAQCLRRLGLLLPTERRALGR